MENYPSVLLEIRRALGGLSVRLGATAEQADYGHLVVDEFERQTSTANYDSEITSIEWNTEHVTVRTSRLNSTILYYWIAPDAARCLIGTDLAELTARIIATADDRADIPARIREIRPMTRTIGSGTRTVFDTRTGDRRISATETVILRWTPDPVQGESAVAAGTRQIEALRREMTAAVRSRPVTAVVSGGVDSGLVAALAQQAGTAPMPWP
ncbi:asparagine synthase-related protein [Nocardia amikacinitolerans]|uniref:asparagine synthase-related protein n=1 Tax=Nocardia amikacinitolerans TaxID=756689 RepID=UPI000BE30D0E|nr:asparagine synthase-related protein [Nocardia amikacinitolerans]